MCTSVIVGQALTVENARRYVRDVMSRYDDPIEIVAAFPGGEGEPIVRVFFIFANQAIKSDRFEFNVWRQYDGTLYGEW